MNSSIDQLVKFVRELGGQVMDKSAKVVVKVRLGPYVNHEVGSGLSWIKCRRIPSHP